MTAAPLFALGLVLAAPPAASANPDAGTGAPVEDKGEDRGTARPAEGTVYTYYGLRKLELDESVSDEEKLREWQAFIERAQEQITYARGAIERWKNAARLRVIESVQKDDQNADLAPKDKMKSWERLLELYPRSKEARTAKKRIAHWRGIETKRLVEAAELVERGRAPKVERIRAWRAVADWVKAGPESRAATRRIDALQNQLFEEAQSLDKIARVDAETKLAVWRDVLNGSPTPAQTKVAEKRIKELEAGPR